MRFVLTENGFVDADKLTLAMEGAKPSFTDKFNPMHHLDGWWEGVKEDTHQWATNVVDSYYEFISWAFKELTTLVTTVPIDLLSNDNAFKMQALFMGYGVLMMIFLAMAEGYKAIMGFSYTKPSAIFGRTFIALIGAGLTMPAVVWLVKCSNLAVEMVMVLGETYFNGTNDLGGMIREFSASGTVNFFGSLLFMVAFFYFIVHALFKVGIRWFNLLMNMVASPFAWASYVTNGTTKFLSQWMSSTGRLILINLVYAFYVVVISTIVMAPGEVESAGGWVARMLLILGGLYGLAHPPNWIRSMDVSGGQGLMPMFRGVKNMMMFKALRGAK